MEAKFCPQCGTPRLGNFCGKCGFGFLTIQKTGNMPMGQISATGGDQTIGRQLPNGLVRGEYFDPQKHCGNCGLVLGEGSTCQECGE